MQLRFLWTSPNNIECRFLRTSSMSFLPVSLEAQVITIPNVIRPRDRDWWIFYPNHNVQPKPMKSGLFKGGEGLKHFICFKRHQICSPICQPKPRKIPHFEIQEGKHFPKCTFFLLQEPVLSNLRNSAKFLWHCGFINNFFVSCCSQKNFSPQFEIR